MLQSRKRFCKTARGSIVPGTKVSGIERSKGSRLKDGIVNAPELFLELRGAEGAILEIKARDDLK